VKVLIANKYLYAKAGAETVVLQEREYLKRRGIEVIDFAMAHPNNIASDYSSFFVSPREYRQGGRAARIGSALSLVHSREAVKKITELIDRAQPDIVHCHNVYHQLTPSIINAAKRRGKSVVLTVHDYKPVCPVRTRLRNGQCCSLCRGGDFFQVLRNRCADGSVSHSALLYGEAVVQRWLGNYENVDYVLAPSRFMRDSLIERFRRDRLVLLYNGVDVASINATEHDDGYVLYCGRVAFGKGVDTLLAAHATAAPPWQLVVAGDGPLLETLRSRYSSNVRFTGHLSRGALEDAVKRAAVVAVPSNAPENCPMSILEAMAYGKPVVATRSGGIPELVLDGVTGFLFDVGNTQQLTGHIDRLMSDLGLRRIMGKAARQRAATQFSLEQHTNALMKLYATVMARPSRAVA